MSQRARGAGPRLIFSRVIRGYRGEKAEEKVEGDDQRRGH